MYKLIIADDDEILLEGLTTGVPWDKLDVEVVAALNDGIHIMEKIEETDADFLLTDIRMSQMDGLEVLRLLHKNRPQFPVIMLTAYDEFSYVQQALRHGALDYLLKPVDLEQLYEVTEKVKAILNQRQAEIAKAQKLKQSLEENHNYRQKTFLIQCLENKAEFPPKEYPEFISSFGDEWCVAELHINPANNTDILKVFTEYAHQQDYYFLDYPRSEHLIILHSSENLSEELPKFQSNCKELASSIGAIHISFISGTIEKGLENLHLSWESIHRLRSYQFAEGNFVDLSEKNIHKYKNHPPIINKTLINNFVKIVTMGNSELVEEYTKELKENLRQAGSDSLLFLSYVTGMIYDGIKDTLCWEDFNEQYFTSMYTQVLNQSSLDEAIYHITQCAKEISEKVASQFGITGKNMIRAACAYVEENYNNSELRITDVAKHVGLSPNYFSKLFAEEMNMSFTDYLISKRMKEAQALLLYTPCTSAEIAEKVGYPNSSYFSNVFKKYTGVTVSQYKKNINHGNIA